MRKALLIIAAAALAVSADQASPKSCAISQQGSTYNFYNLGNPSNDWTWNDPFNWDTKNNTFVFNICQNVVNIPTVCKGITLAPAYIIANLTPTSQSCNYLGSLTSTLTTFYDNTNPAAGAILNYNQGPSVGPTGCQSQFSIAFMCADFPFPSPVGPYSRSMHYVQQVDVCQYVAYAPSQVGCPQECPIVNGAVCSGKGICGFDNNLKVSRCFCDDGYDEVDCNTPRSPFPTGAVAGSTIGGLTLGAAGIFGWTYFAARRNFAAPSVDGFYGQM